MCISHTLLTFFRSRVPALSAHQTNTMAGRFSRLCFGACRLKKSRCLSMLVSGRKASIFRLARFISAHDTVHFTLSISPTKPKPKESISINLPRIPTSSRKLIYSRLCGSSTRPAVLHKPLIWGCPTRLNPPKLDLAPHLTSNHISRSSSSRSLSKFDHSTAMPPK